MEDCWKVGGGGVVYVLFLHLFPENVSWASSFFRLGFNCLTSSGEDKIWTFQHILGNWSVKFHTWGSRELARKNTRLPHYFNGFPELLGRGLIIASSLSGDCAGVFWSSGVQWRSGVERTPPPPGEHGLSLMYTYGVSTGKSRAVHVPNQTSKPRTVSTECEWTCHACHAWWWFLANKDFHSNPHTCPRSL